ncbi:MAG: ABC transporter ATP-binding protein [Spirochaetota bacterium]
MESHNIVEMERITKQFGTLKANDQVDFALRRGEVHAILGENGAGKSTLMSVLSGIYLPDSGTITINGQFQSFHSPQDAIYAGIGMIYQHFKLVEALTAWENICAGVGGNVVLKPKELKESIREICEKVDLHLDLDKRVRDMGVGERQTLEIVKVLYRGADILILDEPTTVLTPQETQRLFSIVRTMRSVGKTAIIITHKLSEVMEISDRVTIMRKGKSVATVNTREVTEQKLAELMVGKAMKMKLPYEPAKKHDAVMRVRNLSIDDKVCMRRLEEVSFDLFGGEILGVAGVSGSGQKQLCQGLTGLQKVDSGQIFLGDSDIAGLTAREIWASGVAHLNFVPEDRLGMGLVASMSLIDNIFLRDYRKSKGLFLDRKRASALTEQLVTSLDIMHPGVDQPIRVLSGGNLQKVLIGREIISGPRVLIAAYPVRGLDLGVTHKVIELLNEQKAKGVGVLLIAEDLDLLMEVSDRIMVLYCGQVSGIVKPSETTKEQLGLMMSRIDQERCNA